MQPHISDIVLGVNDIARARAFYVNAFGLPVRHASSEFASLGIGEGQTSIGLYPWYALAEDAGVSPAGEGFRRFALSFIVESANEIDTLIERTSGAGGQVIKPAKRALWGGYSAYIEDPDGHLWKLASSKAPPIFSRRAEERDGGGFARIQPNEIAVTLGAADIKHTKAFYNDGLAYRTNKDFGKFVSFCAEKNEPTLGLYTVDGLAADAGVASEGAGFSGLVLSHLVATKEEVDKVLEQANAGGGKVIKPGQEAQWGGYFGYFCDSDGQLWKVARSK